MASSALVTGRPVLVFDGDCGFCTTAARIGQRRLRLPYVEPWQFLDLEALGVTEEACSDAVQWIHTDGEVASAERAVIAALRHAGGVWKVLGGLLALPGIRAVAGVAYRWVARNRYRLPGGTAACRLTPP